MPRSQLEPDRGQDSSEGSFIVLERLSYKPYLVRVDQSFSLQKKETLHQISTLTSGLISENNLNSTNNNQDL